jgi:hypothetical protein
MKRSLRADLLLVENVRTLLSVRGLDDSALAVWCGHKPAWISKILSHERGVPLKDLGKIADFFGLTVSQLLQDGISPLTERRRGERRQPINRRSGQDRRQAPELRPAIHPDVNPFPPRKRRPKLLPGRLSLTIQPDDFPEGV